jgi:hypothetical protein
MGETVYPGLLVTRKPCRRLGTSHEIELRGVIDNAPFDGLRTSGIEMRLVLTEILR